MKFQIMPCITCLIVLNCNRPVEIPHLPASKGDTAAHLVLFGGMKKWRQENE